MAIVEGREVKTRQQPDHYAVGARRGLVEDDARAHDQGVGIVGRIEIAAVLRVPEMLVEHIYPSLRTGEKTLVAGGFPERERRARHLRVIVGKAGVMARSVAPGMMETVAVAQRIVHENEGMDRRRGPL